MTNAPARHDHSETRPQTRGGRVWMMVLAVLILLGCLVGWWLYSLHKTDQARSTSVVLPVPPNLSQPLVEDDAMKLAYEALEKMGEKREVWTPIADNPSEDTRYLRRNGPARGTFTFTNAQKERVYVSVEVTGEGVICTRGKPW